MQEILQDFNISTGGRPICYLSFEDYIDLMEGNDSILQDLTTRLEEQARAYGMELIEFREKQNTCQQYQPEHPH